MNVDWVVDHFATFEDAPDKSIVDDRLASIPGYFSVSERNLERVLELARLYVNNIDDDRLAPYEGEDKVQAITALAFMPRKEFAKWNNPDKVSDSELGMLFRVPKHYIELRRQLFDEGL